MWARSDAGYAWLDAFLSIGRFKQLVPEAANLDIRRTEFPLLRALNFVVVGLLGEGSRRRFVPILRPRAWASTCAHAWSTCLRALLGDAPQ